MHSVGGLVVCLYGFNGHVGGHVLMDLMDILMDFMDMWVDMC